jgi:hypothetical protein
MPIGKSILDFSIISLFSVAVPEVTYKILMDVSEIGQWAVKWKNIDPTKYKSLSWMPSLCSGIPTVLFYQSLSNDSRCESFGFYHFHQLTKASF